MLARAAAWRDLLTRRLQGGFARNLALLIGSTAIGQLLVVAALPIISRLYLPADMGRLGAFLAFLGTAAAATALRYDVLIVAGETPEEAAALAAGVCLLTVPTSVVASVGLALLIRWRILGYEMLPMSAALWMFPALVATQLYFTLRYWLMRDGEFRTIARVTVGQNAARAVGPVMLYPLASSWIGLLGGEVLGRLAGIWAMMATRGTELRATFKAVTARAIRAALAKYPESPLAGTPSALITSAANYLALPLIASGFGVQAAGYFSVVQRGMQIPISLIGRNVADVFHAKLAGHMRSGSTGARRLFWQTGGMLLLVGGIPSIGAAAVGPPVVRWLLGPRWGPAAELLVAMIPWSLASFVVVPLSRAVVVYRGQVQKLLYDVASIVAMWSVFAYAGSHHWTLLRAVWVMSVSQAGTYVLYLAILVRMIPIGAASSPQESI